MRNENKTSETPEKIKFTIGDMVKFRHNAEAQTYIVVSCVARNATVSDDGHRYGLYNINTGRTIKEVWSQWYVQKCIDRVYSVNLM